MDKTVTTLDVFYESWKNYQELLKGVIAPLTAEQLRVCPTPTHRSLWISVAHIIAARVYWFGKIMGEGDADFRAMQAWDDAGQPERSASELNAGLDTTWAVMADCIARWTPDDLAQTFERRLPDGRLTTQSRNWIVWHLIEHDLHHGGEISLLLGINGLAAPDI